MGKILFVRAGQSLSLQYHRVKDESWYVESGRAVLELGAVGDGGADEARDRVPATASATAPARCTASRRSRTSTILEVSTPHLDDVVRLEDAYGRAGTSTP